MRRSITLLGAGLAVGAFLIGCELSPSDPGKIRPNEVPEVFFLNTHASVIDTTIEAGEDIFGRAFLDTLLMLVATETNYSSIISWYGTDVDGFIDHYEYAIESIPDDTLFSPAELGQIDSDAVPDSAWITSTSTSDTVLFQAPSLRDRHRLWLRAVDDRGGRSQEKWADFLALTDPPVVTLSCSEDDLEAGDCPTDSVFALFGRTPTWQGVTFNWEAEDPDGTIVGYMVKIDNDGQSWFTTEPTISLTAADGLTGGRRTVYIFAIDDAGAISPIPAQKTLEVTVPTFDRSLLVVTDGNMDWQFGGSRTTDLPMTNEQFGLFYAQALVAGTFVSEGDQGTEWDVVRPTEVNKAVLGQYSHVLWVNETPLPAFGSLNPEQVNFDNVRLSLHEENIASYLAAGGNFIFIGALGSATDADLAKRIFEPYVGITPELSEGRTAVVQESDGSVALDFIINGEPFTDSNANSMYEVGEPFDDFGFNRADDPDVSADLGEDNGYWDGGWSELYVPQQLFLNGFDCGRIKNVVDRRAQILYYNGKGKPIGAALQGTTFSAAALFVPLHMAGFAYNLDDVDNLDPYGTEPWTAAMPPDQGERVIGILRNIFTITGLVD